MVKGVLINENLIVRSCVLREQVVQNASRNIVKKTFGGSLPCFVAAFLKDEKLTPCLTFTPSWKLSMRSLTVAGVSFLLPKCSRVSCWAWTPCVDAESKFFNGHTTSPITAWSSSAWKDCCRPAGAWNRNSVENMMWELIRNSVIIYKTMIKF